MPFFKIICMTRSKFYPIVLILLCSGFLFYKYILQVYPGIMTDDLMRDFHLDGVGLGNLAACYFYAYLITQPFAGVLLDRYSSRWLTAFAILVGAVGAIIFAHTDSLWGAQLGRVCMGFASAFATVCYLKNTALWFEARHFAFVGGLLATAAMLGAIFGEAPLSVLVTHLGWRDAVMVIGVFGLVFAVLMIAILRDKPNTDPALQDIKYGLSFKDFFDVIKKKQNWLLTFYSGLTFTPLAVFCGLWGNPFLVTVHHISTTDAATFLSFAFLGFGTGSPILGLISDRLGKRKPVMIVGALVSLISICFVIYIPSIQGYLLGTLFYLFGFGIGSFMLCFAIGKDLNPLAIAATVIAMVNSGDSLFGSFTEPLIGKILDAHGAVMVNGAPVFTAHAYQLGLSLLPLYLVGAILILFQVREN